MLPPSAWGPTIPVQLLARRLLPQQAWPLPPGQVVPMAA